MVGRILGLIHSEIKGLHEAAYLLGLFALLSQIFALARDRLLASSFGAGSTLDVYYASFRIPDIIFVGVASLVSVYVLIPFLAERQSEHGEEEKRFIAGIFSAFTTAISLISLGVFLLVPYLVPLLFPGIADAQQGDLVMLTRLLLLQPLLLGISNLFGSVTQTKQRFILYALGPIFYNIGIIVGVLFLYPLYGIMGLGWGVIFGACLHVAIQLPFIVRSGFLPRWPFAFNRNEIKEVVLLSLPRTIGLSVHHISLLILISLASLMTVGSITIFNFALNLQSVPFTIIAVSYSVAAFPTLARLFSKGDRAEFLDQITTAARHIIFWSFPAIVLVVVLRAQIVRVTLGSGVFDWVDTRLTAAALALFALSLIAQGLVLLFVRGYYAAGNTKTPLLINTLAAALMVIFSYVCIRWFETSDTFRFFMETLLRVEGLPGTVVLMLPLSYSLAYLLNALALWFVFRKDFRYSAASLKHAMLHSVAAALALGVVAHYLLDVFDEVFNINTFLGILCQGALSGTIGIVAGVALLVLLGNDEIRDVWETLHRRFWRARAVAPEPSEL